MKIFKRKRIIREGDLLSSPTGIYTYEITNIDYSVNPPLVYFKEFTKKANIETVHIKNDETYKILGVRSYG